jgi:16S rRNA (adenine1518-N6/adenine1519-N6)-dimethyltransferase
LAHPQIAERIVRAAGVTGGQYVLEIGPGKGILTAALLAAGARVVAVEADGSLLPALNERFARELSSGALTLVVADIRDYLAGPMEELPGPYAVIANIPYYITGEILRLLLEHARQPRSVTLLVQKGQSVWHAPLRICRSQRGFSPPTIG